MCIFCKIANKELPSTLVYEDAEMMAFNDIHPQAKTHILVIPKKHIDSVLTLKEEEKNVPAQLVWTAKKIAEQKGLEGYRLSFNVGEKGGQIVFHLHLHLMANQ